MMNSVAEAPCRLPHLGSGPGVVFALLATTILGACNLQRGQRGARKEKTEEGIGRTTDSVPRQQQQQ